MPKSKLQKPSKVYVGIDPGANGGIAFLSSQKILSVVKMPGTERDIWDVFHRSKMELAPANFHVMIEKVHSMPQQGIASSFKFGMGYGGLRMALTAAEFPFETCTPHRWQKALRIPKRGPNESKTPWKNRLKAKAQQLFPDQKVTLAITDALLIAEFCKRYQIGNCDA